MEWINNLTNRIFELKWFYCKIITFFVLSITAIDTGILSFIPQLNLLFIISVALILNGLSTIMAMAIALPADNFNYLEKDITKKMQDIKAFTGLFMLIFAFVSVYICLITQKISNNKTFDAFFELIEVQFFLTFAAVIIFTLIATFRMLKKNKTKKINFNKIHPILNNKTPLLFSTVFYLF